MLSPLKFSRDRISGQKQQEEFLGTRVLAEKESLDIKGRNTFVDMKTVIAQECGQTLGLGLGQSKDIVVVIISLQREKR